MIRIWFDPSNTTMPWVATGDDWRTPWSETIHTLFNDCSLTLRSNFLEDHHHLVLFAELEDIEEFLI